jgi:hypothetical protein
VKGASIWLTMHMNEAEQLQSSGQAACDDRADISGGRQEVNVLRV